MRRLIFALLLMAVACSTQAQPPTSPSAAVATPSATATAAPNPSSLPVPSTSAPLLFAALEGTGTASWDSIAIVGLDGHARALTSFVPMPVPTVGCTGKAVLPLSAHVAAGRVYFADGTGVVQTLNLQGMITTRVATFPLTSGQQMLSFAVSPDGSRLLGTIFTLPAEPRLGCSGTPAVSGYSIDVYAAKAGGASTLLYHENLPVPLDNRIDLGIEEMVLVGWDQVGPIATYPGEWVSQGHPPLNYAGTPVRVDSNTGKVLMQVSDPTSCYVQDMASSGDFVCSLGVNGDLSVRRPDGSETWRAVSQPKNDYFLAFLSPDEGRLVAAHSSSGVTELAGQDGSRVVLAGEFWPAGWLDSTTVVGGNARGGGGNLTYVALSAPGTMVDMGFKGQFIGTVHT